MNIKAKHIWFLALGVVAVAAVGDFIITVYLTISGPTEVVQGACTSYEITANSIAKKVTPVTLTVGTDDASSNQPIVAFYTDQNCTTATDTIMAPQGSSSVNFYMKSNSTASFYIMASAKSVVSGKLLVSTKIPPKPVANHFGALVGVADDKILTADQKISVAKSLGVPYVRAQFLNQISPVPNPATDAFVNAGLKVIPSFRNLKTIDDKYSEAVANMATYKTQVQKYVSYYKPEVIVIENEENNKAFIPDVTVEQYVAQLNAATDVAHQYGTKVANGGFDAPGAQIATWNNYWTHGQQAQADSYANRVFANTQVINDIPNQQNPTRPILAHQLNLKANLDRTLALLAAYKNMPFDYINFHWYKDVGGSMEETAAYLRNATGKVAMNNELGQWDTSTDLVNELLKDAIKSNLAYTLWYSADGTNAIGLQDGSAALRPNGEAFKAFISTVLPRCTTLNNVNTCP